MKPRLLKRIKSWEEAGVVSASDVDANEIMESVRDDLEKLFNTRRGTVLIDQNYGLPDFTHLMNGYAAPDVDAIERDLAQQVKQYEPRLLSINLAYKESKKPSGSLSFSMSASFAHKNQDMNLAVNVQFYNDGSVSLSL